MRGKTHAVLLVALVGCAQARTGSSTDGGGGHSDTGPTADATCGEFCDHDHDGVYDGADMCPNTAAGAVVNMVGCADAQLTSMLVEFPPFGLTWTPTGDLGRAGGLTWTYVGIDRKDLFHIDWIVCDDPATPCGLSLDGPIDVAAENWVIAPASSDLPGGKLVYTNTTHIALADTTTPQLNGRLTITVTDASGAVAAGTAPSLNVTPRSGTDGVEIKGTGFVVVALGEVQDPTSMAWSPYLDYYDAAPTVTAGGGVTTSFGGSFYAK